MSFADLMSKLMVVSGLNTLHKLFMCAMTNPGNKLTRIGDSKHSEALDLSVDH